MRGYGFRGAFGVFRFCLWQSLRSVCGTVLGCPGQVSTYVKGAVVLSNADIPPAPCCAVAAPPPPALPRSGVYNDLGSGSNVDLCIITADKVDYLRNYEYLQGKTYSRQWPVKYAPGTAREFETQPCRGGGGWKGTWHVVYIELVVWAER
jgi:hypothetical protein